MEYQLTARWHSALLSPLEQSPSLNALEMQAAEPQVSPGSVNSGSDEQPKSVA
jgi:hypothetical protein